MDAPQFARCRDAHERPRASERATCRNARRALETAGHSRARAGTVAENAAINQFTRTYTCWKVRGASPQDTTTSPG